jgi:hypothetical protein
MTPTDTMGAKPVDALFPPMRGKSAKGTRASLKGCFLGCGHPNKEKSNQQTSARNFTFATISRSAFQFSTLFRCQRAYSSPRAVNPSPQQRKKSSRFPSVPKNRPPALNSAGLPSHLLAARSQSRDRKFITSIAMAGRNVSHGRGGAGKRFARLPCIALFFSSQLS